MGAGDLKVRKKGRNDLTHLVMIEDSKGKSLLLSVRFSNNPFSPGGSWQSLANGMIRHPGGELYQEPVGGISGALLDGHWNVHLMGKGHRAIQLWLFSTRGSVNDSGAGFVFQPSVLAFEPGTLTWKSNF